ncbi:MAG: O-antigen ligase family protein [Acidobacteria bacterium]|nr:O-antigen ligase family protein [Acidobacteriota bacterium]
MPTATNDRWNRAAFLFLLLFAAALPHSIAAAQAAVGVAALVWAVGLVARRRRPTPTPLDLPLLLFLGVSALAAVFSLEPALSLSKLRGTGLALIVLVTAGILTTRRQAAILVSVLLGSATLGAVAADWEKIVGRGAEVVELSPTSPFGPYLQPRDVILRCDQNDIHSPDQLDEILARHDLSAPLACEGLRGGILPFAFTLPPERFPKPAPDRVWGYDVKPSRSIRARGTYSHFVTYAEVLLQLTALAGGLWLVYPRKWSPASAGVALVAMLLAGALAATFTRASWAALVVAGLAMLWTRLGWRLRLATLLVVPPALLGLNTLLVKARGVGFYNPADLSVQYRRMMWEDGWRLISEHPWLGVGMDTVLVRWQELGLRAYQQLKLHSHFHSTPVQLAVERGLLGLAAWLLLMGLYLWLLLGLVARTRRGEDGWSHGLAVGIFGATVGFLLSGLLHYNFGDSEVVMVFWLLAGVAVSLDRLIPSHARVESS